MVTCKTVKVRILHNIKSCFLQYWKGCGSSNRIIWHGMTPVQPCERGFVRYMPSPFYPASVVLFQLHLGMVSHMQVLATPSSGADLYRLPLSSGRRSEKSKKKTKTNKNERMLVLTGGNMHAQTALTTRAQSTVVIRAKSLYRGISIFV